ncbi:hypothetical protein GHT06_020867 [Daphnia sinensis]|uniref:Cuticle protein n=1 Tax=Daphnia sinensis TaxID=1820382 RepID=A0AAD5KIC6_9CRUS|nr:hypothetical protein GHT06_020867 [Daphnia sinensis]
MKIAILLVLLGLAKANVQLGTHKRSALFSNGYPNYPVIQRVTRAQPAIYPPGKAVTWVDDYYERSYAPQPYSFAYDVNDGYNNYGHQQQSDGSVTSGSYRVLLPDGRTQIVNFRADKNGYVADVKYEAPVVAPLQRTTNAGQGNKAAWTAFTAFQPAVKTPSYKQDLMAALGFKTTPAGEKATINPQYKVPAAAPAYRDASVPAYKPVAAPPAAPTGPAYPAPVVATVPEYRPAAGAETKVIPAAPSVQVYRVPADRTNKAPAVPAPVPAYRQPPAPEYKAAVTPAYQVASAPEYAVPESVYKAPETPPAPYRPTPTTPAYKPREVYTTPYLPPTTTPSAQAVYESSTPAPQFRPAWTAFRYAEASTASPYAAPAQYNIQPTTSDYPIAVTTPAYRPPPPAYEAPAQEESVYEVTTVPAELSTTPSYQNYAAPWTAFRATEAPYQSPAVPSYVPSTTVNSVRYETSTESYVNEATPDIVTSVYSDPESSSPTYEQGAAWTERPSVGVPAEETTTYKPDINDVTTTRVVYEAPTSPTRAVPSDDATGSPWNAGFRPASAEAPLYYVAPTTYRPLNPPVYKVPDARTVYESNNGSRTSSSGPAWSNAWTAFRSAPVRPAGRPGYEVSTHTTPASKLPPPLLVIFAALLATTLAYGRYRPNYHPLRESTPYEFEYDVNDGDNQHGHRQRNDGRVTSGSYRVALPDGRTQIVTYRADDNGYNADVTYEESDYNPYRPPAPQSYYPPAPPSYYPPAPAPLIFRAPSHLYQPAAPLPKPLIFRAAPSHTSPAAPEPNRPFYTSPAVPPFGAPAIQDYVAPVPLLFRNNVAYKVTPHAEYMDRIPLEYRSAFAKRSLPVDLWNESSILEVLPSPAEVEADVNVVEDEASATPADDVQVEAAVESSKAYANERSDYATLDEAEEPLPNAEDVEVRQVRSDSPSGNSDVIEFDDLPFPLPLPLAFRPYV